jgi:lactate dehydrogenase-like 2-hydroxyacid dehydrogenase
VGLGTIARAVAKLLVDFGTRVLYHALQRADEATEARLCMRYRPVDELFETATIMSLNLPSKAETRRLTGATHLAQMQPAAVI